LECKQKITDRRSGGKFVAAVHVDSVIYAIRGEKVILDADLALIYEVSTKRLNEQVRRNKSRFPADFAYRLTWKVYNELKQYIKELYLQ
jgi:hypothetical protein